MSAKKDGAAILGLGAAACAVCCAGPIIGFLAAIGLGTVVGTALFGTVAVLVGALAAAVVIVRRRRHLQATACTSTAAEPIAVELTAVRSRH